MAQQVTPAADSGILITEENAAKAFEAWETAFRDNPSGFMTQDEIARISVADYGIASAIYFLALLRKVNSTTDAVFSSNPQSSLERFIASEAERIQAEAKERSVRLDAMPPGTCPQCEGKGDFVGATHVTKCDACNGTGRVA